MRAFSLKLAEQLTCVPRPSKIIPVHFGLKLGFGASPRIYIVSGGGIEDDEKADAPQQYFVVIILCEITWKFTINTHKLSYKLPSGRTAEVA